MQKCFGETTQVPRRNPRDSLTLGKVLLALIESIALTSECPKVALSKIKDFLWENGNSGKLPNSKVMHLSYLLGSPKEAYCRANPQISTRKTILILVKLKFSCRSKPIHFTSTTQCRQHSCWEASIFLSHFSFAKEYCFIYRVPF